MSFSRIISRLVAPGLLVALGFVILATTIFAQGKAAPEPAMKAGDSPVVAEPYFAAGQEVVLDREYQGPVFVAGSTVRVTETAVLDSDLIVAGGSIIFDGTAMQDVYAAGGTVTVRGKIDGNLLTAGGEVRTEKTSSVGEHAFIAGENVHFLGDVLGDIYSGAKRLELAGMVGNNVNVSAQEVQVDDGAVITGNLKGEVAKQNINSGASVVGMTDLKVVPDKMKRAEEKPAIVGSVGKLVFSLIGKAAFMFILAWLFGKQLAAVAKNLASTWTKALTTGAAVVVLTPLAALGLMLTILGVFAGLSSLALLFSVLMFSWVVVAQWIGMRLLPKKSLRIQAAAGGGVVAILCWIPVFGWLFGTVIAVIGAGQLVNTLRK